MGKRTQHNLNRWKKLEDKHRGAKLGKFLKKAPDFDFKRSKNPASIEEKSEAREKKKLTKDEARKARKEKEAAKKRQQIIGRMILPHSLHARMPLTGPLEFVEKKLARSGQLSWQWLRSEPAKESVSRPLASWPPTSPREILSYLGVADPKAMVERIEGRFSRLKNRFIQQEVRSLPNSSSLFDLPPVRAATLLPARSVPTDREAHVCWASLWAFLARFASHCPLKRILDGLALTIGRPATGVREEVLVGEYSPSQVILLVGKSWADAKTCIVKRRKPDGMYEVLWDASKSVIAEKFQEPIPEESFGETMQVNWEVSDEEGDMSEGSFFE